jgi:hypothetical protein
MRRFRIARVTVVVCAAVMAMLLTSDRADAGKRKPKPSSSDFIIIKMQDVSVSSLSRTRIPGPDVTLSGDLHLVSQALVAPEGTLAGFRLHTNLAGVSASSDTTTYVAVGAGDAIPSDCGPEPCQPSTWAVTFRLVPNQGSGGESLLFDLVVVTEYDADGSLVGACVIGQDGCGTIL